MEILFRTAALPYPGFGKPSVRSVSKATAYNRKYSTIRYTDGKGVPKLVTVDLYRIQLIAFIYQIK